MELKKEKYKKIEKEAQRHLQGYQKCLSLCMPPPPSTLYPRSVPLIVS